MPTPRLPDLSRKPRAHLPGSADPPSVEGWREKITDLVWADEQRKRVLVPMQIAMGMPLRLLIRECADRRGMSSVAYVRRAVAAFIAADLGVDLAGVCSMAPPVRTDRSHGRRGKFSGHGPGSDDGAGYGHWHACDGRDCDVR